MAKTKVTKISDKLKKVNDSFTINMYDNGYMIEIGGRNDTDDWSTAKIMVQSIEELTELIKEASEMERE
jgi:ketol-acid reductoisomerase